MRDHDLVRRRLRELACAIGFFTRLPVGGGSVPPPRLSEASWAFPVAGALVGVMGGLVFLLAHAVGLPSAAAALLALCCTAVATGALHEDGLADTADAIGCGGDRDRKLAVMRDSRIGAFGALALIFSVALRVVGLAALGPGPALAALVASHAVSRAALPLAMAALPNARSEGLGAAAGAPETAAIAWSCGLGLLAAVVTLGPGRGLVAVVLTAAVVLVMLVLVRRQLGGYTGDVLGAVQQVAEITMLLAAAAR